MQSFDPRARICVTGQPGSGKTTLIEGLLRSCRRPLAAARVVADDRTRGLTEEQAPGEAELRRYAAAGALATALLRCPLEGFGPEAFAVTPFAALPSDGFLLESRRGIFADELRVFVANVPPVGFELYERTNPPHIEVNLWDIAEPYRDFAFAQVLVLNLRGPEERERAEALLADMHRLRKDSALVTGLAMPLDLDLRRVAGFVADLSDARDEGTKKALARIRRAIHAPFAGSGQQRDEAAPVPLPHRSRSSRNGSRLGVLEFEVELVDIQPRIWRRIQLRGDATFWDLHCAIQDAMGWLDCHLHAFELGGRPPRLVGIPAGDDMLAIEPGWELHVADAWRQPGSEFFYEYDFGDGWRHRVVLRAELDSIPRERYPRCVAGERACPPEDCGGPPGYDRLLAALADTGHAEHEELANWVGGSFDAEAFDPAEVRFTSAKRRLTALLDAPPI